MSSKSCDTSHKISKNATEYNLILSCVNCVQPPLNGFNTEIHAGVPTGSSPQPHPSQALPVDQPAGQLLETTVRTTMKSVLQLPLEITPNDGRGMGAGAGGPGLNLGAVLMPESQRRALGITCWYW